MKFIGAFDHPLYKVLLRDDKDNKITNYVEYDVCKAIEDLIIYSKDAYPKIVEVSDRREVKIKLADGYTYWETVPEDVYLAVKEYMLNLASKEPDYKKWKLSGVRSELHTIHGNKYTVFVDHGLTGATNEVFVHYDVYQAVTQLMYYPLIKEKFIDFTQVPNNDLGLLFPVKIQINENEQHIDGIPYNLYSAIYNWMNK